jgi:hypothetical protein
LVISVVLWLGTQTSGGEVTSGGGMAAELEGTSGISLEGTGTGAGGGVGMTVPLLGTGTGVLSTGQTVVEMATVSVEMTVLCAGQSGTSGGQAVMVCTMEVYTVEVVRGMVLVVTWVDSAGQSVTVGPHEVMVTSSVVKSVETASSWPWARTEEAMTATAATEKRILIVLGVVRRELCKGVY